MHPALASASEELPTPSPQAWREGQESSLEHLLYMHWFLSRGLHSHSLVPSQWPYHLVSICWGSELQYMHLKKKKVEGMLTLRMTGSYHHPCVLASFGVGLGGRDGEGVLIWPGRHNILHCGREGEFGSSRQNLNSFVTHFQPCVSFP